MAISRNYNYNESTRPKLSRNIYDYVYDGKSDSNSLFASSSGGYTVTNQVGADMSSLTEFVGAINATQGSAGQNGERGLVPAPLIGDQFKFLQGSGGWTRIPAFEWLQEYPSNSSTKTGLTIDGNFNVTNTLSTQTLKVEGAAHFWSLLISEAKASGGQIIISPALYEVDYVGETNQYAVSSTQVQTILTNRPDISGIFTSNNIAYVHTVRAYMRNDDGEKRTQNECTIGDMLRCKSFNVQAGVYNNVSNKDYWTFVVAVSNGTVNYNPGDGTTVKCFWIDLADYLITSGGGRVNFNSSLTYAGEIITDPDQNDNVDLTDLKRQAQRTYNGSTAVSETEYGTVSDYTSIILSIYGASGSTRSMVSGNAASEQNNYTSFELTQLQAGLNQIVDGSFDTYDDNSDASNLTSLILDETISNNATTDINLDDANTQALRILGIEETTTSDVTPTQSASMTPSGMNRAPAASPSSGDNYNWTTDPDYTTWQFGYGSFDLGVGDHLASLGHLFDKDRMNAIVISADTPIDNELDPPAIAQYTNIDRFGITISKFRTTALANNGNEFTGSFLVNHNGTLMDVNERINMFITDLNTGLETVGIHLDGTSSTIKLVGSVEIRQHDTNNYDTLSVYDSSNNKKVEITPKAIPALTDLANNLVIPANNGLQFVNYNYTYSGSNINISESTSGILWWKKYNYTYSLQNASHTYTVSCNIGDLVSGDKLTVGSGTFTLNCPIYFNGMTAITNRTGQTITSFYMRIKRGTTTVWTVDLKNNFTMPATSVVESDQIKISIGSNMKSQTNITTAGSYSVEFEITVSFKAIVYEANTSQYANPRMGLDSSFAGSFNTTIERSSASVNAFMQIGNNGLAFNMGANKYMYASNSAMKFNWMGSSWSGTNAEGVGIAFSDTAGMQIIRNIRTLSASSNTLQLYDDVVILNCSGKTSISITLPSAANYGKGRILEVITINRSSSFTGVNVSSATMKNHAITVSWEVDDYLRYANGTYWDGTYKFISDGSSWYEL